MKKLNSAIAVCGLALCGCSATGATAEEVGLTDAQINSIASFFAAPIKSVATITPRYAAFAGATFTATDEVSSTARHSDLCLTGTKMPLLQSDVTASPEGYVMLNTLGLNTSSSRLRSPTTPTCLSPSPATTIPATKPSLA